MQMIPQNFPDCTFSDLQMRNFQGCLSPHVSDRYSYYMALIAGEKEKKEKHFI